MEFLFELVYDFLKFLETATGFSYEEINVYLWFIAIPFSWAYLVDRILEKHYLKIFSVFIILVALIISNDLTGTCKKLFEKSVDFLNIFNGIGSNYKTTSVIVCVFVPLVVYYILIKKAFFKSVQKGQK